MIGNLNKKVQLLFFLFLPLIGLGQDFDFHDIKKIDSKESFKRFALENLFVKATPPTLNQHICLCMDINQKERRCGVTVWATWIYSDKSFEISFVTIDSTFETITNQIKLNQNVHITIF